VFVWILKNLPCSLIISTQEPLQTGLCPSLHCIAVSHLSCLSKHFLESSTDNLHQTKSDFIPRGGHCPSCNSYTLWGDIIRGSYHRFRTLNKAAQVGPEENMLVSDDVDEIGNLTSEEEDEAGKPVVRKTRKRLATSRSSTSRKKASSRTKKKKTCVDSSNSESSAVPVKRKRGPCTSGKGKKAAGTPSTKRRPRRPTGESTPCTLITSLSAKSTPHENIDSTLTSLPELYDVPMKRKRGRPRKLPLSSNADRVSATNYGEDDDKTQTKNGHLDRTFAL